MIEKRIKCPTCLKESTWNSDNAFRPFCSERCRLIDLGEWLTDPPTENNDEQEEN